MFNYPAIYKDASALSEKTQKLYLRCFRVFLCLLVFSSVLFSYFDNSFWLRIVNAVVAIGIVIFSFVFHFHNFQGIWYNARAVAESIKTTSWRFAMKAAPYNINDNDAKDLLIHRIVEIVNSNIDFKQRMGTQFANDPAIPDDMIEMRSRDVEVRKGFYYENRIVEQKNWYIKKSSFNKNRSLLFFIILAIISIILCALLFISTGFNDVKFPIESLLSIISAIFIWIQTKRYSELEKSYALTVNEIRMCVEMDSNKDMCENTFSDYVNDTENAFSREHTQWLARKK
jgi:energy-coupling factor transporter transmembrane protein EcfT